MSHLDQPTGDSWMGVLGMAGLVIVVLIILLLRAPSPGDIAERTTTPVTVVTSGGGR